MKKTHFSEKLARVQIRFPKVSLVVATALTALAAWTASRLDFDSSYEALLPKGAAEVKNADEIRDMTGGTRQVVVAIEGQDPEKRLAFGRRIENDLKKLDKIRAVDLTFPVDFLKDRALWLMDPGGLDELISALEEAVRVAKSQGNPMALHLDEEAEEEELEQAWKKVDAVLEKYERDVPMSEILTSDDGRYTFMVLVPTIKFSDMEAGQELLAQIDEIIDKADPASFGVRVRTAGNLDVLRDQHRIMLTDLRNASFLALGLGVLIVASFTRRLRAPFLIGAALICGVAWTFAITELAIGQVNIITGFLVAVIIGLGIDFGVHLFVRFNQELQKGLDVEHAVVEAVKGTLPPALTSAMTTAGTFYSFSIANFRGFSEFGMIAGTGVILTLVSSFTVLPPLLLLATPAKKALASSTSQTMRTPSTGLCWTVVVGLILVAVAGAASIGDIPFRNDFKKLRGHSEAAEFLDYVDKNLGLGFNPAVILVPTVTAAQKAKEIALEQEESGFDGRQSRIARILTVSDLIPKEIEAHRKKIEELKEILSDPKLDRAEDKDEERAAQLKDARQMVETVPWTVADLPEQLRRRFTTLSKDRFLVYVWPDEHNNSDTQAMEWEDELDALSAKLDASGIEHRVGDETLILAWVTRLVLEDGPRLLLLAVGVVIGFLLIDFRSGKKTALVFLPLAVGMFGFIAMMRLGGIELNMFNLIVLPSVIGIGIDNAVHIYHRYASEGPGSAPLVVKQTGVAAFIASSTTAVGFGSSLISHHTGLQQLGATALIGIAMTFIAAVIFFPCALVLIEKYKTRD